MNPSLNRRHLLGATASALGTAALPAWAQTPRYASRPIMLVVPFAPGGAVDVSGRAIADRLGKMLTSNLAYITNGRLRALAVAAPQRVAQLPAVPTFEELKLPALNLTSWTGLAAPAAGLAAPARAPDAIVSRLYESMRAVLADPATKLSWEARGAMLPGAITPAPCRQEIAQRIQFCKNLVKTQRIALE